MAIKLLGKASSADAKICKCKDCSAYIEYHLSDTTTEKWPAFDGCTYTYNVLVCPSCEIKNYIFI